MLLVLLSVLGYVIGYRWVNWRRVAGVGGWSLQTHYKQANKCSEEFHNQIKVPQGIINFYCLFYDNYYSLLFYSWSGSYQALPIPAGAWRKSIFGAFTRS